MIGDANRMSARSGYDFVGWKLSSGLPHSFRTCYHTLLNHTFRFWLIQSRVFSF
jgi:hypothetical protein